ncbi:uncharacterized protein BCR38DRAFT_436349 [Pseudomassariella vexata]|uniref:Uncharacterized protein n=1 Tax=Pseudomassariella vexata TaxID=1141098 RepID=A0A1Y2DVE2_9PEZI|nr:uncharacterized protein BCR38DRAFT_436349 [Pseudomassariella vexata]ORY63262.1 hypothetical protein BCR38DRAFT_436349 [Pseudomassariella vexata]
MTSPAVSALSLEPTNIHSVESHELKLLTNPSPNPVSVPDESGPLGSQSEIAPERNHQRNQILRSWIPEITSFLGSLLLLVAIVVVLRAYDGIPQPEWATGINLNSLIAILSTICRATMLVVIAEVISQLKWIWFDKIRPLGDLEMLDRASRGFWGSLRLLFSHIRLPFVMIAAFVVVVSGAFGSFTQQAIRTSLCKVPVLGYNATVPVAHYVDSVEDAYVFQSHGPVSFQLGNPMKSALVNALTTADDGTSRLNFNCPTGDCTFPDQGEGLSYSSIGMCNECVDITSSVRQWPGQNASYIDQMGLNLTITGMNNNQSIAAAFTGYWSSITAEQPTYESLWGEDSTSQRVTYLTFTWAPCTINETDPVAGGDRNSGLFYNWICPKSDYPYIPDMENSLAVLAVNCTFYPCLRNYKARVTNGILQETTVSHIRMKGNSSLFDNPSALKEPCFIDGLRYDAKNISEVPNINERNFTSIWKSGEVVEAPTECVYRLSSVLAQGITQYMRDRFFEAQCWWDSNNYSSNLSHVSCPDEAWWLDALFKKGFATFDTVDSLMRNVSVVATNRLRTVGIDGNWRAPEYALGTVWNQTVCTNVDWRWIVLPVSLEFLTFCVLVVVVGLSWQERETRPVWKSSVLPLLFHGLKTDEQRTTFADTTSRGEESDAPTQLRPMQDRAQTMAVRLITEPGSSGFLVEGALLGKEKRRLNTLNRGKIHRCRDADLDSLLEVSLPLRASGSALGEDSITHGR